VGERSRAPEDPRPPLDPYTLLDLTLNWRSPGPGPELHLGVKNLNDADVRYPDQLQEFAGVALPYPESYPRPGRQLWLSVGYVF
jgi:iron complex outermembrane receptor protein